MRRICTIVLATLIVAACDEGINEPAPDAAGVTFQTSGAQQATFNASGNPASDPGGTVLSSEFAMAQRDSVGGVVIIGYQPTTQGKGDVFILQITSTSTGSFACTTHQGPCHGRLFTGVTGSNVTTVERAFYIDTGSVTISEFGPGRIKGSFSATLKSQDGHSTIQIDNGVIDVPLRSGTLMDGAIGCLVSLAGAGQGSCRA